MITKNRPNVYTKSCKRLLPVEVNMAGNNNAVDVLIIWKILCDNAAQHFITTCYRVCVCVCVCSREQRVPNKDLVKLFIRARALRSNFLVNSPWIVDENFVRKHSLPPVVYPSPHKVLDCHVLAVSSGFVMLMLMLRVL